MKSIEQFFNKLQIWIVSIRAPFFTCTIIPIFLGAAVAWSRFQVFKLFHFLLSLGGTLSIHTGANLIDDYFDYKSGTDFHEIYEEVNEPFFGGSGVLVQQKLSPTAVYRAALFFFIVGAGSGLYLGITIHWTILLLGSIGIVFGYFHVTHFAKWGMGELSMFLNLAFLPTLGSFFVQVQRFVLTPIIASIPMGLLMAAMLLINSVPDRVADESVGKKTIPVRIGEKASVNLYTFLMIASFFYIGVMILIELMPVYTSLTFTMIPLAVKAILVSQSHYNEPAKITFANLATYLTHFLVGILLIIGYLLTP